MSNRVTIGPGVKVKLKFAVLLENGEVVDSTGDRAAEFIIGDGNVLPGFERAMFGLTSGERRDLAIPAEMGFGKPNPENYRQIPRTQFAEDIELGEGLAVAFADANRNELPGVIESVGDDMVVVNFNHPLAGRNLVFQVEIIEVERVSDEIIRVSG